MGWDFWKDAEAYQERPSSPALNEGKTFFKLLTSSSWFHFTPFGVLPTSISPSTLSLPTLLPIPNQAKTLI